jgi:hypothetical protein
MADIRRVAMIGLRTFLLAAETKIAAGDPEYAILRLVFFEVCKRWPRVGKKVGA